MGETVGDLIMGMPAQDLLPIYDRSKDEMGQVADKSDFKQFTDALMNK